MRKPEVIRAADQLVRGWRFHQQRDRMEVCVLFLRLSFPLGKAYLEHRRRGLLGWAVGQYLIVLFGQDNGGARWFRLGWAGLGWAGLGWAGLVRFIWSTTNAGSSVGPFGYFLFCLVISKTYRGRSLGRSEESGGVRRGGEGRGGVGCG